MKNSKKVWKKIFPPKVGDLIAIKHPSLPLYQDVEVLEVDEENEEVWVQWKVLGFNKWLKRYVSYTENESFLSILGMRKNV